jgi:hypothetical protein
MFFIYGTWERRKEWDGADVCGGLEFCSTLDQIQRLSFIHRGLSYSSWLHSTYTAFLTILCSLERHNIRHLRMISITCFATLVALAAGATTSSNPVGYRNVAYFPNWVGCEIC